MHEIDSEEAGALSPHPESSGPAHHEILAQLKMQGEMLKHQGDMIKSIRRSLRVAHFLSFIKIALILAPFILALIYLPPLIKEWTQTVQQIRENPLDSVTLPKGIDIKGIQDLLNKSGLLK